MAAITIHSDFRAQEEEVCHYFYLCLVSSSQLCFSVFGSGCQPAASALSRMVSRWAPGSPPSGAVCLTPLEASRVVGSILHQTKPRDSEVLPLALSQLFLYPSLSTFHHAQLMQGYPERTLIPSSNGPAGPQDLRVLLSLLPFCVFSPGITILDWVQRNVDAEPQGINEPSPNSVWIPWYKRLPSLLGLADTIYSSRHLTALFLLQALGWLGTSPKSYAASLPTLF